jgi:plastocyanin
MTNRKNIFSMVLLGLVFAMAAAIGMVGCNENDGGVPDPWEVDVMATSSDTFSPQEILVDNGTTVKWTNIDTDPHTVVADPLDPVSGGPHSDPYLPDGIAPGESWSWIVPANAASGTKWYYHCRIHGAAGDGDSYGTGMVGLIVVK